MPASWIALRMSLGLAVSHRHGSPSTASCVEPGKGSRKMPGTIRPAMLGTSLMCRITPEAGAWSATDRKPSGRAIRWPRTTS